MQQATGYRTKNRQMILGYLRRNKDTTVCVSDIYNYLKENNLTVNLTTIYRYLDKLVLEKQLIKYAADKGEKASYQYVDVEADCLHHLHLQCVKCGKIFHVDQEIMEKVQRCSSEKYRFHIDCNNSILYGVCDSCNESVM